MLFLNSIRSEGNINLRNKLFCKSVLVNDSNQIEKEILEMTKESRSIHKHVPLFKKKFQDGETKKKNNNFLVENGNPICSYKKNLFPRK